jgi:hypothetical protein
MKKQIKRYTMEAIKYYIRQTITPDTSLNFAHKLWIYYPLIDSTL